VANCREQANGGAVECVCNACDINLSDNAQRAVIDALQYTCGASGYEIAADDT
jgi:hypothetical protein